MRIGIVGVIVALLSGVVAAQDADWPVEERCVGDFTYPSVPPTRWDFEGKIVSLNDEGVRVIQAADPQQYFIALSSDESFPERGAFSPDGQWFAYFTGSTATSSPSTMLRVTLKELVIVSTDGSGEPLRVPWNDTYSPSRAALAPQPVWLSSLVVAVRKSDDETWYALDRAEGTTFTPTDAPDDSLTTPDRPAVSHDGRYSAYTTVGGSGTTTLHYADHEAKQVYDLCIDMPQAVSSAGPMMSWSPDNTTLAFTVDGFPVLLTVETLETTVLRYETGDIIAWLPPPPVFKQGRG